jgi:hypothetical protein
MNPTLKNLDLLKVVPYNDQKIRPGDVIVFQPPGEDKKITHRVISVNRGKITARGDNNLAADRWSLSREDILGQVVSAQRGEKEIIISGGAKGRWRAGWLRTIRLANFGLAYLLRPLYQRLAKTELISKLLPLQSKIKVLSIKRPAGTEFQLLLGRRIIGRWLPGSVAWRIQPPFKILLNEFALPDPRKKT